MLGTALWAFPRVLGSKFQVHQTSELIYDCDCVVKPDPNTDQNLISYLPLSEIAVEFSGLDLTTEDAAVSQFLSANQSLKRRFCLTGEHSLLS